jgi:hypothetical protein
MKVYVILVTQNIKKLPISPITITKTYRFDDGNDLNNYIGVGEIEMIDGKIDQLTELIYTKCNFSESQKTIKFTFKFRNKILDPEKNIDEYDFKKELIPNECIRIFAYC